MTGGDLAADRLATVLATQRLGRNYTFLSSCASTSDEVASRAATGAEEGLLVATDEQSKGRGRRGRTWHSPAGENLYFSLLLRPALAAQHVPPLTLLAGAALAQSLASLGFSPRLKWPNDVLLEGPNGLRKLAGILAEMASENGRVRHVVLGVGINVNTQVFPADLAEQATSLALARGCLFDRAEILAGFLNAVEPLYDEFVTAGPASAIAAWQRHACFGQACWVDGGSQRIEGIAESLDEHGALQMRTADGALVPVHAGEINWKKRTP